MAVGVGTGRGATNEVSGLLQKGLFEEEANHNLEAAIQAYRAVVTQTDKDHQFAATAIFRLGECYRKQGRTNEANAEYQRILREYPDQTELVTLSRQQLGSAGGLGDNFGVLNVTGQAQSGAASAGQIAELKKLSVEKRRVAVQQMFPNPVLNTLMQKMTETEQELAVLKNDYGDQHPDVVGKQKLLKTIQRQIDDQVEAVLAGRSGGGVSAKADLIEELDVPPRDVEESEIRRLQAMLRDSPDLLNIRVDSSGTTRLHKAAEYGQLSVVKFLLDNGADVNARSHFGYTPLHTAVLSGRKNIVEVLLSRGAKVDVQDKEGKAPLHYAAERGYKAIAELLLAHGATVDAKINAGETAGETPLHEAAHAGNGAIAELLLANKADVNARDVNGGTPLYIAAEMGHPAVIELLLAHGADINATRLGMTPLMKAIAQNYTDAAKTLLQHGADVKIQMPKDSGTWGGWAALQFAVDKNNAELVKLLLEKGADVNLKAQYGNTPLMAAVNGKELEITKLLLEYGAEVNSRTDGNHPSTPRWTALAAAVSVHDNELVRVLLEHQADPNLDFDLRNNNEWNATPLIMAAWNRERQNVKTLLEYKANPDLKDKRGYTALFRTFGFGNRDLETATVLLENKASTEIKYDEGKTLLFFATEANAEEFAELLLAHGAQPNARNDYGKTPLHMAAFADSLPMVELLLAHGADVNAKDNEGNTPLDMTAKPKQMVKITERDQIRAILREHGGVAEADIATIRVMRSGQLMPKIIFRKDRGAYNYFKLFELMANMYGEAKAGVDPDIHALVWMPEAGLAFPDFSKLKVIHLAENRRTNVEMVEVEKALAEGDCSGNISLKWGDILEVPETDHKVTDVYGGLSEPVKDTLSKCLAREVEIIVKGQSTKVKLSPDLSDARMGGRVRADGFLSTSGGVLSVDTPARRPTRLGAPGAATPPPAQAGEVPPRVLTSFWLSQVVHGANVILASSDLTRVRVKRAGGAKAMVFNLEKTEPNGDLWLEDGDVIEIPEKTGE